MIAHSLYRGMFHKLVGGWSKTEPSQITPKFSSVLSFRKTDTMEPSNENITATTEDPSLSRAENRFRSVHDQFQGPLTNPRWQTLVTETAEIEAHLATLSTQLREHENRSELKKLIAKTGEIQQCLKNESRLPLERLVADLDKLNTKLLEMVEKYRKEAEKEKNTDKKAFKTFRFEKAAELQGICHQLKTRLEAWSRNFEHKLSPKFQLLAYGQLTAKPVAEDKDGFTLDDVRLLYQAYTMLSSPCIKQAALRYLKQYTEARIEAQRSLLDNKDRKDWALEEVSLLFFAMSHSELLSPDYFQYVKKNLELFICERQATVIDPKVKEITHPDTVQKIESGEVSVLSVIQFQELSFLSMVCQQPGLDEGVKTLARESMLAIYKPVSHLFAGQTAKKVAGKDGKDYYAMPLNAADFELLKLLKDSMLQMVKEIVAAEKMTMPASDQKGLAAIVPFFTASSLEVKDALTVFLNQEGFSSRGHRVLKEMILFYYSSLPKRIANSQNGEAMNQYYLMIKDKDKEAAFLKLITGAYKDKFGAFCDVIFPLILTDIQENNAPGSQPLRANVLPALLLKQMALELAGPAIHSLLKPYIDGFLNDIAEASRSKDESVRKAAIEKVHMEYAGKHFMKEILRPDAIPDVVKILMSLIQDASGQVTDDNKKQMVLLGGFLMLRLVCPAISAPFAKEWLIVPSITQLSEEQRKGLVVHAKILQNISNAAESEKSSAKGQEDMQAFLLLIASMPKEMHAVFAVLAKEGHKLREELSK